MLKELFPKDADGECALVKGEQSCKKLLKSIWFSSDCHGEITEEHLKAKFRAIASLDPTTEDAFSWRDFKRALICINVWQYRMRFENLMTERKAAAAQRKK